MTLLPLSASGTAVTRSSWTYQHLRSAAYLAGRAASFEPGEGFPAPGSVDTPYVAFSTSAIIEAACALESSINELRSDLETPSERTLGAALAEAALLRQLWYTVDRGATLEKVQWILLVSRQPAFDKGSDPFQSAADVIELRNELVHFKAQWTADATVSAQLERRLAGKFSPSGWASPTQLFFPYRCIGAGAAEWAWRSSRSFIDAFYRRLGTSWPHGELASTLDDIFAQARAEGR